MLSPFNSIDIIINFFVTFFLSLEIMMELQGKQNAIEKIEQLFIRMDFSKIPMFDDSVIKRIDQIREILTSFHNKWNDIIK